MDEIEDVVGDKESVEADDLDKLTYMHQVHTVEVPRGKVGQLQIECWK